MPESKSNFNCYRFHYRENYTFSLTLFLIVFLMNRNSHITRVALDTNAKFECSPSKIQYLKLVKSEAKHVLRCSLRKTFLEKNECAVKPSNSTNVESGTTNASEGRDLVFSLKRQGRKQTVQIHESFDIRQTPQHPSRLLGLLERASNSRQFTILSMVKSRLKEQYH